MIGRVRVFLPHAATATYCERDCRDEQTQAEDSYTTMRR
jgi:hypothetical protein